MKKNLSNFIRDIRKDLSVPNLPFVIAETGMSGHQEKHPRALSLMKAQAAVAKRKEFQGNVAFVGTKDFFRPKAESPSGQAYHWNNNAETYYLIGEGMGKAMLSLLGNTSNESEEIFHVYAPSRSTKRLLIVEASKVKAGTITENETTGKLGICRSDYHSTSRKGASLCICCPR